MQAGDAPDLVGGVLVAKPELERCRPAEQVALHHFAAGGPQQRRLALGLDAFGDDADAERARKPDDGRDNSA